MEDYLRIGVLTSPHGVKGEISVYPTSEDLDRYSDLTDCFLLIKGEMKPVKVTGCKYKKNMPVLKFEGIDDRDAIVQWYRSHLKYGSMYHKEHDALQFHILDSVF